MMEDDDYEDELPNIIVNSSIHEKSQFVMPPAEVLASERAREEECEREIELLRHEDERGAGGAGGAGGGGAAGEGEAEGDAQLAAAVRALRLPADAAAAPPPAARVLDRLLQHTPPEHAGLLRHYRDVVRHADAATAERVIYHLTSCIARALCEARPAWGEADTRGAAAWLCVACVCACGGRARTRRALHRLLDAAEHKHVESLARLMERALPEWRARAELADAARGAGAAGRALAAHLLRAALRDELRDERRDELPARLAVLQLTARLLPLLPPAERAETLSALAQSPPPPHGDAQTPEQLKVSGLGDYTLPGGSKMMDGFQRIEEGPVRYGDLVSSEDNFSRLREFSHKWHDRRSGSENKTPDGI
ncbi:uncharacterized protein ACR2FA_007307 [Aphomia sociella]